MKKFIKVSLITSVIIMLAGIVIYVIGFAGGGQRDVNRMIENEELSYFGGHLKINPHFDESGFFEIGWFEDEKVPEAPEAPETPEAPGKPTVSEASAVMKGSKEAFLTAEGVEKMHIEVGGGELYLESGDVDSIQITTNCENEFKGYIQDDTLYIEGFDRKDDFLDWSDWDKNKNVVHIMIPRELHFQETALSLGAGIIEITDVTLGDTSVEIGAGEVICENTKSGQLSVELGAGAISMQNIEAGETDVEVAMGEAVLSGIFQKDMDLKCSMGNLEVEIYGQKESFNYSVEAAMGCVEIDGNSYEGLASEKNMNYDSDKTIYAETSMGSIEITFTK